MPSDRPISGKTNKLTAPSARIAAIAYDASSSSASMAPYAAIIADTPQTADPIDSRLISFGLRPNDFPSAVISTMATASSIATQARLTPPSFRMSPNRNLAPWSTMPVFSQNSYVSTPSLNASGTPTVLAMTSPKMIAHSTYSMFGSARWCALPYEAIACSTTLPAKPVTNSRTRPGTRRVMRRAGDCLATVDVATVVTASPRNADDQTEFDQGDRCGSGEHGPPVA